MAQASEHTASAQPNASYRLAADPTIAWLDDEFVTLIDDATDPNQELVRRSRYDDTQRIWLAAIQPDAPH